jgi:hypothetical protein
VIDALRLMLSHELEDSGAERDCRAHAEMKRRDLERHLREHGCLQIDTFAGLPEAPLPGFEPGFPD